MLCQVQFWGDTYGDFLVLTNPLWFKAIIFVEAVFQLPACFVLAAGWVRQSEWVRTLTLVYSVHVLTTMVPIMAVLSLDPRPTVTCLLVYSVWVVFPVLLLLRVLLAGACIFDRSSVPSRAANGKPPRHKI